jgi:hypothetical protein
MRSARFVCAIATEQAVRQINITTELGFIRNVQGVSAEQFSAERDLLVKKTHQRFCSSSIRFARLLFRA